MAPPGAAPAVAGTSWVSPLLKANASEVVGALDLPAIASRGDSLTEAPKFPLATFSKADAGEVVPGSNAQAQSTREPEAPTVTIDVSHLRTELDDMIEAAEKEDSVISPRLCRSWAR